MNSRKQVMLSAAIVGLAAATVGVYGTVAGGTAEGEAGGAAGHAGHGAAPAAGTAAAPVQLSAEDARRIGVSYATAELRRLERTVHAVGNVSYDETRLANVNPKVEGWVERLHVDFTGAPVRRGQPLMEVYSPMLVSAQEELILARRLVDDAAARGSERAATNARDLLESSRRRLRYWDVPEAEIVEIERSGAPRKTLTLAAPASGIVVEKNVVVGSRIMPGMDLYRIVDLSRIWLEIEVFEKDLSLLRPGQHGVVTFEAYPGEEWDGLVTYVYPSVSVEARTGRVRLTLDNPGLRLKPGMYGSVQLHQPTPREALVVPRTAVLQTGERAVVFVREANGTLSPRAVTVGLAEGDVIEIIAGLSAGDVVVSSASFLIDAESNLGASLGAMQPTDPGASSGAAAAPNAGH